MNYFSSKDAGLSVLAGALVGIFLLFVAKNVSALSMFSVHKLWVLIGAPLVFFGGFFIASWLAGFLHMSVLGQIAKFVIVGVLNTAIDFGVLNFLVTLTDVTQGSFVSLLNVVSFSAAVTNSYFWNRFWVFEQKQNAASINNFFQFFVISVGAVIINSAVIYILTTLMHPLRGIDTKTWLNIAKVFATAVSLIWNFLGYKFVVFKRA